MLADKQWVESFWDLVGETAKAIKVSDGVNLVWLPKRMIKWGRVDGGIRVVMPEFLARKKGII